MIVNNALEIAWTRLAIILEGNESFMYREKAMFSDLYESITKVYSYDCVAFWFKPR